MTNRKRWLPFIILNIIISAATTLLVLFLWNRINPGQQLTLNYPVATAASVVQSDPQATLPSIDEDVIKISNVIASGDYENEYVVLSRVGEGALNLSGWMLVDLDQHRFIFPDIDLLKGDVEVYSKGGANSVNKLFWNAGESIWQSGETVTLFDSASQQRAIFEIP
jgi:hypothetical protein